MKVTLDKAGKRYNRDWVFRNLTYHFESGKSYAVLGPNGSGKSTLMQLIAGNQSPTEGQVMFSNGEQAIATEHVFQYLSLCAPYMQLIEEFTLTEQLQFHFNFKKAVGNNSVEKLVELLSMQQHAHKQIRHFSSGMKQRVKLCLSVLSDVPVVLLDEPATNLDDAGVVWYRKLLNDYVKDRLLIISSNRIEEYEFCNERILLERFK